MMMYSITTRQRDMLQIILQSETPLVAEDLARQLDMTPRQVRYGLKGVISWLAEHEISLQMNRGVGIELNGSREQFSLLEQLLSTNDNLNLVLTAGQRQQLVTFQLLTAPEPLILQQLELWTDVSRTTLLRDLDVIEEWVTMMNLNMIRRPNYGLWIGGDEHHRRQALAAILWGDSLSENSLTNMTYDRGLTFALSADVNLLPIVAKTSAIIKELEIKEALEQVSFIESEMSGQFTDTDVLYLSLIFGLQIYRIRSGFTLEHTARLVPDFQRMALWPVAQQVLRNFGYWQRGPEVDKEIAGVAMYILAASKNDRWPGDLGVNEWFVKVVDDLMRLIAEAYDQPLLMEDQILRDGLFSHTVPAFFQQQFEIWKPVPLKGSDFAVTYPFEYTLAKELGGEIEHLAGVKLPSAEIDNLVLLLRGAYLRVQPQSKYRVIVICPSGMATAQLLVTRLRSQFPMIDHLDVLSLRELTPEKVGAAGIIISTVDIPRDRIIPNIPVIKVHPSLRPEDIERISQALY